MQDGTQPHHLLEVRNTLNKKLISKCLEWQGLSTFVLVQRLKNTVYDGKSQNLMHIRYLVTFKSHHYL